MAESSPRRKLAVILATDVVGYSTKMEENEDQTLNNFMVYRSIIDGLVEEYHGRIFNTLETQSLWEFQKCGRSSDMCLRVSKHYKRAQ